jgi:hypothetical protein
VELAAFLCDITVNLVESKREYSIAHEAGR